MRLKALKVQGFKSFADATTVEFHEGITAIVGPNGCGKSNISDAIRWVLGEQNGRRYLPYIGSLFLFILLPLLGLIYSAKPFRTKTNPYLSIVTICIGLVTPMMLGYFMNSSDLSIIPFFVILFLFCLSVVPIKQAEEAAVDKIIGMVNLYTKFGEKIIFYTLSGLSLVFVLTLFLTIEHGLKGLMLIFTASIFAYILFYTKQKKKLERLYQHIIYIVTGEGVLFFCFRKLF